jgi:folate-binding protein YgfZ
MNVNDRHKTTVVSISGPDAKKLLQGQLTCDLEKVKENEWRLGAHCNPKGRVVSLFHITLNNNSYYLRLPSDMAGIAIDALKKYAIFYKVKIDITDDTNLLNLLDDAHYKIANIRNGIPDVYQTTTGKYLPHELNLHKHDGISLDKGCYTGQEIIARMHYLGKLKNHLYSATINALDLTPGQDIYAAESTQPVASMVDACNLDNETSIALILTDDSTAKSGNLHIGDKRVITL